MAEPVVETSLDPRLPRVTIQFCTQCKWMLRAAYYAQELLSTFSLSLGEVSLQPATGGIFLVEITITASSSQADPTTTATATTTTSPPAPTSTSAPKEVPTTPHLQKTVLWDRKIDGGFPETKELKRRVRDVIQPGRDLGHVDREYPKGHVRGKSSVEEGVTGGVKGEGGEVKGEREEAKKQEGGSGSAEVEGERVKSCGVEKCEDCE
ncbi:Rdx family-domain-containing protein [Chaetomium sp. MPI-SDFR-AT-0129]|nr:Rdx family-domain-containing protein [Chaetomium sp. MPI-SDFR-AT-0129]